MINNSSGTLPEHILTCDQRSHAMEHETYSDAPRISVCMPVYNSERYLVEAIESVLAQTFRDFEFLIIDDGSTDGSLRILKRYAASDPRIRMRSRANQGVAATLNELVGQARGEFIARMDADDIALPERFEKQTEYLRQHRDCVLVGSRVWEIDTEGDRVSECCTLSEHEEIDSFHFRMQGPALIHPSVMMRRDAVLSVGNYRAFRIEDVDLYLRLAEHGRMARIPEFLLKYRVHSCNVSQSDAYFARSYHELSQILTDACRRRNLPVNLPPPEVLATLRPLNITPAQRELILGWRALLGGQTATARKYARRAVARHPLSLESWRLMCCAVRGH